ncbi:MAG: hypothetical protein N3G76_01410 [Candidatus Micrarchaeota archaeon]|nr:hypothetical protein [Candidatus Micrarchaeota archaeon]
MREISAIISEASEEISKREAEYLATREKCENAVRVCGRAMQLMHAGKIGSAREMLDGIAETIKALDGDDSQNALVAKQEYAEAQILLHVLGGSTIPGHKELGVPADAYLLGLLDALGEVRREVIEHMRKDDYENATKLFEAMSDVYELLLPLRFSNAMLPGFRRKLDVARSLVEQCRRDLLMFKISKGI